MDGVLYWIQYVSTYQTPQSPHGYGQPQYPPPVSPPVAGPPPEALPAQGIRLLARFLDAIIIFLGLAPAAILIGIAQRVAPGSFAETATVLFGPLTIVALLLYEPVLTWRYGGTLGKRMCGLRVARLDTGEKLTFGQSAGRWGCQFAFAIVPLLGPLNALWCLWDKPFRLCLHDKVVGSVVVKRSA